MFTVVELWPLNRGDKTIHSKKVACGCLIEVAVEKRYRIQHITDK